MCWASHMFVVYSGACCDMDDTDEGHEDVLLAALIQKEQEQYQQTPAGTGWRHTSYRCGIVYVLNAIVCIC